MMTRLLIPKLPLILIACSQHALGLIASKPHSATAKSFTNSSVIGISSSPAPTACCFLVQDTVSEVWWQITSYSSTLTTVNLTAITTLITKFPNATLTTIETNVYPTPVSPTWTYIVGANPIANEPNYGPSPSEVEQVLDGPGPITTADIVVQSPAAFLVYNSVKVITAAPVTDQGGNIACGTTSEYNEWDAGQFSYRPYKLTDINSNAEAYFGGSNIFDPFTFSVTSSSPANDLAISGFDSEQTSSTSIEDDAPEPCCQDTSGSIINSPTQTEVVICLKTPFIYQPSKGARGFSGYSTSCHQTGGTENYGYVPRKLLDFLIENSQYSSQYPGLESCLPGGPSILQSGFCSVALGTIMESVHDLTSTTVIYVTPPVLVDPTQSDFSDVQVMVHASGIDDDDDGDFSVISVAGPIQRPTPQSVKTETPKNTPQPLPSASRPTPLQTPIGTSVPTLNSMSPSPLPASKLLPGPLPAFASLGQIINSIIGGRPASQVLGKSAGIVIPAGTTIPAADIPFFPGIVGVTSTISGNPVVIIPNPTTLASPLQAASEVVIPSATTIPIAELPFFAGVVGSTETSDGAVVVIVSEPTTLSVLSIKSPPATATQVAEPDVAVSEVQNEHPTTAATGAGSSQFLTRVSTVPFNPDSPVPGSTITSYGKTYVVVSTTVSIEDSNSISQIRSSTPVPDTSIKTTQTSSSVASETSSSTAVPILVNEIRTIIMLECFLLFGFFVMAT